MREEFKDFVPHPFGNSRLRIELQRHRKFGPVWLDHQVAASSLANEVLQLARNRWANLKVSLLQDEDVQHLAMQVLIQILDLHKPIRFSYDEDVLCTSCDSVWPCRTFMKIEDANAKAYNEVHCYDSEHDISVDEDVPDYGGVYGVDPFPDH